MTNSNGMTPSGAGETPSDKKKVYAGQAWDQAMPELIQTYGGQREEGEFGIPSMFGDAWDEEIEASHEDADGEQGNATAEATQVAASVEAGVSAPEQNPHTEAQASHQEDSPERIGKRARVKAELKKTWNWVFHGSRGRSNGQGTSKSLFGGLKFSGGKRKRGE